MIEKYVPHDQSHDDFCERFLQQRIGKLNSFPGPLADDSITFPIQPTPTVPATKSQKPDSVTSRDSRVGLPQVFSPTLPITPEHLLQHSEKKTKNEQPSTSFATRPLAPIQQFLRNSCRSKAKKPKYFRPQPHDPNSQSVLRKLTRQGYKL